MGSGTKAPNQAKDWCANWCTDGPHGSTVPGPKHRTEARPRYIYLPLMAFLVHLFFSPHSNQHARNHQRECFLGGGSCRVLRCHRVRISPHLLCSIADLGPCCADSRESWPSKHAFTSGCTHLISRCTKSWCVILSFNAPNTTRLTFRRSLWFGEQWHMRPSYLACWVLLGTAGYWISPILVLYALLFGTISLQTSGTWSRVFGEMFHRKL